MGSEKDFIFKIVSECNYTFILEEENPLHLLLLYIDGRWAVEVDTNSSFVGRCLMSSRKESEALIEELSEKLGNLIILDEGLAMLKLAFALKTLDEFRFILNVYNQHFDFNTLTRFPRQFNCIYNPRNPDILFENKSEFLIKVFFKRKACHIGTFTAKDAVSLWQFKFNPNYLLKYNSQFV